MPLAAAKENWLTNRVQQQQRSVYDYKTFSDIQLLVAFCTCTKEKEKERGLGITCFSIIKQKPRMPQLGTV